MCWGLHIMEGDEVVRRIDTTAAAIEFFGAENVRYDLKDLDVAALADPRSKRTPQQDLAEQGGDFCLCPIDKDYLLDRAGYVRIPVEDERWDSIDTRIERWDA